MALVTKKNIFPVFADGDVMIFINTGRVYQLHSSTLQRHSPYFNEHLSEEHAAVLSPKAKKDGVVIRFRLELVMTSENDCGELKMKVRILGYRSSWNFIAWDYADHCYVFSYLIPWAVLQIISCSFRR
jgi:hypothetical protein